MVSPDEFVLTRLDRIVLWFHHWGIDRKWVVRAVCCMLIVVSSGLAAARADYFIATVNVLIPAIVLFLDTVGLKMVGKRVYNSRLMALRAGFSMPSAIRSGACFVLLATSLSHIPSSLDGPFWALWIWILWTYVPTEPPKRSWKELLAMRQLAPIGANWSNGNMTFEELKNAGFVKHHDCSACGSPVGYQVHPEIAAAVFQSGCDCGRTYPNYRLLTHEELAAILPAGSPLGYESGEIEKDT